MLEPYTDDLAAPPRESLRLAQLLRVLEHPVRRRVVERLLADPPVEQGVTERPPQDFAEVVDVRRHLHRLRRAGWIHQRPVGAGLVSRLRRADLDQRYPGLLARLPSAPGSGNHTRATIERATLDAEFRRLLTG